MLIKYVDLITRSVFSKSKYMDGREERENRIHRGRKGKVVPRNVTQFLRDTTVCSFLHISFLSVFPFFFVCISLLFCLYFLSFLFHLFCFVVHCKRYQGWPMKMSKIVLVKTVENGKCFLTPKCRKQYTILNKNAENWFSTFCCLFFTVAYKTFMLNCKQSLAG